MYIYTMLVGCAALESLSHHDCPAQHAVTGCSPLTVSVYVIGVDNEVRGRSWPPASESAYSRGSDVLMGLQL
jgi:hypothetical protein